jgi:hypothetical protein
MVGFFILLQIDTYLNIFVYIFYTNPITLLLCRQGFKTKQKAGGGAFPRHVRWDPFVGLALVGKDIVFRFIIEYI